MENNEEKEFAKMISMTDSEKKKIEDGRIAEWLSRTVKVVIGYNEDTSPIREDRTILEYLTQLVVCNWFSYNVSGWGAVQPQDAQNPYGMYGLVQHEALQLMNYHSLIVGAMIATGHEGDDKWFFVNVSDKVEKQYKKDLEEFKKSVMESDDDPRKNWFNESHSYPPPPMSN